MQERRNSSAFAMELHLSCTNPEKHNSSALAMELHLSCINPEKHNSSALVMELHLSCTNPERHNSSALKMELHISCTNPLKWCVISTVNAFATIRQNRLNDDEIVLSQIWKYHYNNKTKLIKWWWDYLNKWPYIWPWIKTIFHKLDIAIHVPYCHL